MVAANEKDDIAVFPVVENVHHQNILHTTCAPAAVPDEVHQEAVRLATLIAKALKLRGVLGIEMFYTAMGGIYVNELAPRPHNSGHYTIESCNFSQYEAHIRGICNWPLPQPKLFSGAVMVNILGEHVKRTQGLIASKPNWHFHYYGKDEMKAGRKMGHITVLTDNPKKTLDEIKATRIWE